MVMLPLIYPQIGIWPQIGSHVCSPPPACTCTHLHMHPCICMHMHMHPCICMHMQMHSHVNNRAVGVLTPLFGLRPNGVKTPKARLLTLNTQIGFNVRLLNGLLEWYWAIAQYHSQNPLIISYWTQFGCWLDYWPVISPTWSSDF